LEIAGNLKSRQKSPKNILVNYVTMNEAIQVMQKNISPHVKRNGNVLEIAGNPKSRQKQYQWEKLAKVFLSNKCDA
jgi:hypothetical protein